MSAERIFWDVDTQVDFMHPEGKLYVPGAEQIMPNLARLTAWAQTHNILVVSSMDAHRDGDEEFQHYPPHCLVGTPGQEKIPETRLAKQTVLPNRPAEIPAHLPDYNQVILEKQQLDVFTNPNTEALLARLGRGFEVVLYGVVTEICVDRAARGLLDRGYRLRLVRDAVHHLDESKARVTFEYIQRRGGQVVTTEELLGGTGR
ncbi:MAG: cysteine hydrolase family protein [Terriglobia bacterium]